VAARSSFPGLALVELDLAAWREVGGLRREKNGGRALFLAMTDPAAHPAFLAADFAAAFTSATTGHAFSSGLSNRLRARRSHGVHGFSWGKPQLIIDRWPDLKSFWLWEKWSIEPVER